jgi:hypothetical protein
MPRGAARAVKPRKFTATQGVTGRGFHTPCTPVGYLTKVIPVLGFLHGTGWEADDRQGDGAGMPARRAGPVVPDDRAAFRRLLKV